METRNGPVSDDFAMGWNSALDAVDLLLGEGSFLYQKQGERPEWTKMPGLRSLHPRPEARPAVEPMITECYDASCPLHLKGEEPLGKCREGVDKCPPSVQRCKCGHDMERHDLAGCMDCMCRVITPDPAHKNKQTTVLDKADQRRDGWRILTEKWEGPRPEARPAEETCIWTEGSDGEWSGECGCRFIFYEGGPVENEVMFCHKCGKRVHVHAYEEEVDDGEA